eukprot:2397911-Alexandrium_andersonii.AAC.1
MQHGHGGAAGKPESNPAGAGAARSRTPSPRMSCGAIPCGHGYPLQGWVPSAFESDESESDCVRECDVSHCMWYPVWTCDACHRTSLQVKNRLRLRCRKCDYDLCVECYDNAFRAAGGRFPRWGAARMSDPEGDRGTYTGPLDEQD